MHRLFFLTLAALGSLVNAETGAILPDRPGLATGTHTVMPGFLYVESGYQYERDRGDEGSSTQTFPQAVFRIGITESAELDIVWDGWNRDRTRENTSEQSVADVSLGGKVRLLRSENLNISLMGLVSLPVGSAPSTSDAVEPYLGVLWDLTHNEQVQWFGVLQTAQQQHDTGRVWVTDAIVGATFSHNDELASFVEYVISQSSAPDERTQTLVDAGFTYLLSPQTQLDISVGVALNDAARHFFSVGVAQRF